MNPIILPEKGNCAGKGVWTGDGDRSEDTLNGNGVGGEPGRGFLRDGNVEVRGPAKALIINPFVFIWNSY